MSRKKRESRIAKQAPIEARPPMHGNRAVYYVLFSLLLVAVAVLGCLLVSETKQRNARRTRLAGTAAIPRLIRKAQTLDDLLKMTPEQLKDVDIAEMNLLCAIGLPGSENLDVDRCLAKLDDYAARVRFETQRHAYRVTDPRYADHYKHSLAWFKAEMLAQTLQEDCGVVYNMERVREISFTNSKDQFVHGMIDDKNGGTCVSMPVIYIAVGRRLGYPLKLVPAKAHLFARWEDVHDRFNVDVSTDTGIGSHTDEEYMTWPMQITETEMKAGSYLKSMLAADEIACFLAARGHCLFDSGRTKEAMDAYEAAARYAPEEPAYRAWVQEARERVSGRPPIQRYVRHPLPSSAKPDHNMAGGTSEAAGSWPGSGQSSNQPPEAPSSHPPQLPNPQLHEQTPLWPLQD